MTLDQLQAGASALITGLVATEEPLAVRLRALGIRAGREVAVLRRAALGGPLHVRVGTTEFMIRPPEARLIAIAAPVRG